MLTVLRSKAGGLVAKIFIGLLAASFAVWGISDVFRGSRSDTLATVGEKEITVAQFQETFRNQLNRISQQLGKPITPDEARQMGIDRQILAQLIQNAALDEEARRLNIALSDRFIADRVAKMKEFQGLTGAFDVNLFRQRLAQWGLSEAQFLREEKAGILRAGLISAVGSGVTAPKPEVELVYRHRNASRDVQYFRVSPDTVQVGEPTDEQLKAFYDGHRNLFAVPERRQLYVVTALPADLADKVKIDDRAVEEYYKSHQNEFGAPETREVEQIVFPSEEEAKKALERIRSGAATWEDVAKERGISEKDRKLGTFSRETYPDPQLVDAIFSLKEGAVSEPLKGALSISLAKVTKVVPGHVRKLEEVKDEITRRLKLDKAKDLALELHDKVEDARASGRSIEDIAKELGLKGALTPHVSANGTDDKGAAVKLPAAGELLKAAFESDIGVDNDVITTPDDGFVWFDVRDIRPASVEPLEKAREKAVKLWKENRRRELVMEKARALKKRAEAGEDITTLAREAGSEVKTITHLKRNDAREDFPVAAVRAVFAAPEDAWVVAPGTDGVSALVIHSTGLAVPPMDANSDEVKSIRRVLTQSIAEDLTAQFVAALQKEYGVKINRRLWAQITGQDTQ